MMNHIRLIKYVLVRLPNPVSNKIKDGMGLQSTPMLKETLKGDGHVLHKHLQHNISKQKQKQLSLSCSVFAR